MCEDAGAAGDGACDVQGRRVAGVCGGVSWSLVRRVCPEVILRVSACMLHAMGEREAYL